MPSRVGIEYLLPIFSNALGQDDMEATRQSLFNSGNLTRPFHSVNTDINKRIRYLESESSGAHRILDAVGLLRSTLRDAAVTSVLRHLCPRPGAGPRRRAARLGAHDVAPGRGGTAFAGDKALLYRANLWLRTAVRVLKPILEADVTSPDELYDAVQTIDWSQYLTPEHTLAVDCNVRDSHITHSKYAALRVKDAICDQFVERIGRRPSVNVDEPMVGLNLHVYRDHAVLSLESSGESLHKRGYRPILTRAPLNEALAAAIVLLTGWTGDVPFVDPMCGSGVLPIEAAWIALRRPPGLTRRRFGFQGWMDYDVRLWTTLRDEARRGVLHSSCRRRSSAPTCAATRFRSPPATPAPPASATCCASR